MTQEQKELLSKDLCARLPYKVKASYYGVDEETTMYDVIDSIYIIGNGTIEVGIGQYGLNIEDIKPYLFPLESMTDEQEIEFHFLFPSIVANRDEYGFVNIISKSTKDKYEDTYNYRTRLNDWKEAIQWLLKNHFDINGLIPKNLANDATNLNIY